MSAAGPYFGMGRGWRARVSSLDGRRFGMVTVLHRVPSRDGHNGRYMCRCDCGCRWEVDAHRLVHGHTRSCGCTTIDYSLESRRLGMPHVRRARGIRKAATRAGKEEP